MQILVTGSGGFIGTHLIRRLRGRYELVALMRAPATSLSEGGIRIMQGDILDLSMLRKAMRSIDVVVHLAGIKGKDRCAGNVREALAVNVMGTSSVLRAAREAGVSKFILASTYWVYGRRYSGELPCREEDELRPCDVYGMTKAVGEELVRAEDIDWTILRLGHVYGPDRNGGGPDVIATFLTSALKHGVIRVQGSGSTLIDPIYVTDVCKCIEQLLHAKDTCQTVLNVSSGSAVTVRALAGEVKRTVGPDNSGVEIVHSGVDDRSEFDKSVAIDRILAYIPGFAPRPLSHGLEDFLRTIRDCS